jgi:hypothetical protein
LFAVFAVVLVVPGVGAFLAKPVESITVLASGPELLLGAKALIAAEQIEA